MKRGRPRLADYLQHMADALERIERYTIGFDEETFLEDELVQDAVLRNFEIAGEAAKNVMLCDSEFGAKHPELPLNDVYLMRNHLAHGYFTVNMRLVWRTLKQDLPLLAKQLAVLRSNLT